MLLVEGLVPDLLDDVAEVVVEAADVVGVGHANLVLLLVFRHLGRVVGEEVLGHQDGEDASLAVVEVGQVHGLDLVVEQVRHLGGPPGRVIGHEELVRGEVVVVQPARDSKTPCESWQSAWNLGWRASGEGPALLMVHVLEGVAPLGLYSARVEKVRHHVEKPAGQ